MRIGRQDNVGLCERNHLRIAQKKRNWFCPIPPDSRTAQRRLAAFQTFFGRFYGNAVTSFHAVSLVAGNGNLVALYAIDGAFQRQIPNLH